MNGNDSYNDFFERKINSILETEPSLRGFYFSMSKQSVSTAHNYLNKISNFMKWTKKDINELDIDDFFGFMNFIKKNKNGKESKATCRIQYYQALKKFGKYLVARKIFDTNPMEYIDRPSASEDEETIKKRSIGYLDETEIKVYMDNVKKGGKFKRGKEVSDIFELEERLISILFLTTGIRCAAMYKLGIDDIDFKEGCILVTDKGKKVSKYNLSDSTMSLLSEWLKCRLQLKISADEHALFISTQYKRMSKDTIANIVKRYGKAITGKNITPHKLRATYGTQLYNETHDIYFVQECMHHSSPKTTELYVRGQENQSKKASDIMSKFC